MEAYFIVAHIEGGSKKFKLCEGEYVVIGRSGSGCQVVIDDPMCSGKHCKVSMAHNTIYVEDLNSKNGIFLNGVRIIKQNLYLGDKLKVGSNLIYILESKLSEKDKKLLTYHGEGLRKSGDLTFEVDTPNITNRNLGRQNRSTEGNGASVKHFQGRRRVPVDFNPNQNISKSKMMFLDLIAFIIDLSLAMTLFILGVKSFAFFFSADYKLLAKQNSLLKIMFSKELGLYTGIVFLITVGLFFFNRRKLKGSIGERILKIN